MSDEKVTKKELNRYQKTARMAIMILFAVMIFLDIGLFAVGEKPDDVVLMVALVPMLFATLLAYQGQTERAMWLSGISIWGIVIFLTVNNPQSYLETTGLIGRYIFPAATLLVITWISIENKRKRWIFSLITLGVGLASALFGHVNDPDIVRTPGDELGVIYGAVALMTLGLGYLVVTNFTNALQWYLNRPLRQKLLGSIFVSMVVLAVILGVTNANGQTNLITENENELLENFHDVFISAVESKENLAVALALEVAENPDIQQAFAERNRNKLEELTLPGYLAVDNQFGVPQAQFHLAPATSYMRLHQLDRFGDDLSEFRNTVLRANGQQTIVSGLEEGKASWGVRGVVPVNYLGEHVGTFEVGMSFDKADLVDFYEQYGVGVTVLFSRSASKVETFAEETQGEGSDSESDFYIYASSFSDPDQFIANLDESLFTAKMQSPETESFGINRVGENEFAYHVVNLTDFAGDSVGVAVLSRDRAPILADISRTRITTVGISVAMLISSILGVSWLTQTTLVHPIQVVSSAAEKFSLGDYQARADVESEDEIGQLARAFNKMAEEVGMQTVTLAERTREMEASQRVTFAASERTTPEDFLDLLVNLIADQFDVYHCQVYLVDEDKREAVLSQSTGYAGRQLLQRGHAIPLEAQSLVTQCINTGKAVLVAETAKDPNWLPNPMLPLTQSELVVPLKIEDKVIGVMDIQDRVSNRFTEASVPVFESMTEHVAFLYENNELLENIAEAQRVQQQFVTQLENTSDVAGQLATILDPTQLLDQAVTMLQSRFNFYHAHIYLVDETKKNLMVATGSGHVGVILKERGHSIPVDAEKSFVAAAYRNAAPVRVVNTTEDPNWLPNPLLPDTRAEMAVPLITRGQVIGVLDIQDEVVGRFTEVDEDTMLTLAGQLATSVDTARLFVEVEDAAERDRVRFEIANALTGNPTEDEVWDVLLEKALGENVLVGLASAERLEDGSMKTTLVRTASTDPELTTPPIGQVFDISQAPGFEIMDRGEVFISNDISQDEMLTPELREYVKAQGVVSMLTAPLITGAGDQWEGMLRVSSGEAGYFTADRAHMYDSLIELGAVALRSARLRAAVANAAERDRTRFEIAEALSGNPTEGEVWDILLEKALGENVMVSLMQVNQMEDGSSVSVVQRSGSTTPALTPPPLGDKLNVSQSPGYGLLQKGEVFVSNDVANDERLHPDLRTYLKEFGTESLMVAAFANAADEEWQGMVGINAAVPGYFDANKVQMYDALIELGTVALRSARLRGEVAKAAERDLARFEIAEALSGNPTEEEIWDILLEKAMGDNVAVTFSLADFLEDGSIKTVSHRAASNDPNIVTTPVGTTFVIQNDPEYPILDFTEVFISNNVRDDEGIRPESREGLASRGVASLLTTPIPISDEGEWQNGVIRVTSSQPDFFDENQTSKYRTLIELGSVALRAARLRASIDSAAKRTATRLEVTQALGGNLTEDEVLDVLVDKAAIYPEARISIYYEDLESNVRTIVSQRDEPYDTGMTPLGAGTRLSTDVLAFDEVLLKDQIVVFDNVQTEAQLSEAMKETMREIGYTSMMTIPMHMSGGWLGFVFVTSKEEAFFDEDKKALYNILAETGTTALREARLQAAVADAAERDRTRFEIAEALAGNLNEEEVWDVLVEKAKFENSLVIFYLTNQTEDGDWITTIHRKWSDIPGVMEASPPIGDSTRLSEAMLPEYADRLVKGEAIVFNKLKTAEGLYQEYRDSLLSQGVAGMMSAPFMVRDELEMQWHGFVTVTVLETDYFDEKKMTLSNALIESGSVALRAARLRAEADQERERFRVLIENAPEAIVVFNGETGEFMEANQNAVELYETSMDELIGNNPVALSPELQPDGRPSADAAMGYIQEAIDGGTPVFEWLHLIGNGKEIPCEIRLVRLPGYDNPPRLRGSITNISERAAAQQAIVQGDRLKSEFLANMSHELRTPLNSILGYTDVLLMGLDGELDEEVTTDLEAIHENSQHLLNLINDILDLAKIEAGRMTIEVGDVDVSNLLQEVKKTSAGLLVNKEVEMVVEADEKLPVFQADYHRVYQVVNNLVSNAVKFTEKGAITLRAFDEGDEMVIQVEDTGIGISKEDLEVIFEEFTQADTSSTRQHEGTGLGLTITRRLVQMHGGSIMVESEMGKGSIFTARFPMQTKVAPEVVTVVQASNGSK